MTTYSHIKSQLVVVGYLADDDLAIAVELAGKLGRPLLVEGAAGVGKTGAGHSAGRSAGDAADPAAML